MSIANFHPLQDIRTKDDRKEDSTIETMKVSL